MPPAPVAKSGQPDPVPALRTIGQAVRAAREDLGLIRQVVAEASGVSVRTLQRLEDGEGCDLSHLCAVAPVVGLSLSLRMPSWHERIAAAVARYVGADWLLSRPELDATEVKWLAEILDTELEFGRRHRVHGRLRSAPWRGGALDELQALRDKLRRMAQPKGRR